MVTDAPACTPGQRDLDHHSNLRCKSDAAVTIKSLFHPNVQNPIVV